MIPVNQIFFISLAMNKWKDYFDSAFFMGLISNIRGGAWEGLQEQQSKMIYNADQVDLKPYPKKGHVATKAQILSVVNRLTESSEEPDLKIKFVVTQYGTMTHVEAINFRSGVNVSKIVNGIAELKIEWMPALKHQKRVNVNEVLDLS